VDNEKKHGEGTSGMTWHRARDHQGKWRNEALVEQLKTLWNEGMSTRQIARRLGPGITHNMVIGKIHRMGLSGRPSVIVRSASSARVPMMKPEPVKEPEPIAPQGPPIHMTELTLRTCRWPMWDNVETATFMFCGMRHAIGEVYCPEHKARGLSVNNSKKPIEAMSFKA
jgi:GcrA cell cycle regulator